MHVLYKQGVHYVCREVLPRTQMARDEVMSTPSSTTVCRRRLTPNIESGNSVHQIPADITAESEAAMQNRYHSSNKGGLQNILMKRQKHAWTEEWPNKRLDNARSPFFAV